MEQSPLVDLKLPLNELNVIMTALGDRPFREVANIVGRINMQVQPQVAALQAPPEASAPVARAVTRPTRQPATTVSAPAEADNELVG